jgi:hypothetical protein
MRTEFSADRQDADVDDSDEDYDYGDKCTQQDTDQLLNVINSETDK